MNLYSLLFSAKIIFLSEIKKKNAQKILHPSHFFENAIGKGAEIM